MHGATARDAYETMEKVLDTCRKDDREGFLSDTIWALLEEIEQGKTCLDSFTEEMQDHLKD